MGDCQYKNSRSSLRLTGLVLAVAAIVAAAPAPALSKPRLRWGQTNSSIYITVEGPRATTLPGCDANRLPQMTASLLADRLLVLANCGDAVSGAGTVETTRWELELREDIIPEESHVEPNAAKGVLLSLRKQIPHRWDRLLWDESKSDVVKDWKREDRHMPEEDEVELPKAQNIRRLSLQSLESKQHMVVAALRYPWCTACQEKDKAFVKVSKVTGGKVAFADVDFAAVDLREEKILARSLFHHGLHHCHKDKCPLFVFKPDEPVDDPYLLEVHILVEMDEMAMMSDPMAGAPGHAPSGPSRPNFDRFEQDLALLRAPAVTHLATSEDVTEFRRRWDNAVLAADVDATALRQAARALRGTAAVALCTPEALGTAGPTVELWAAEATAVRQPLRLENPNASALEHFVRVHTLPLMQNYSWELKERLSLGLPVALLWVNRSDSNSSNITRQALEAFATLCDKRRGIDPRQHVLCSVMDQSYSYYQREYGSHEPYPYPYFGLTKKLGYGETDRFGFPFEEPANQSVKLFFASTKRAAKAMDSWIGKVLKGQAIPSHESGKFPGNPNFVKGEVQDIVWNIYQQDVNGSTADILLELYDDQRKKAHVAAATLRVVALALKDYRTIKVARMEVSQNYVPPILDRKPFSKDTEYYWVPPSLAPGEVTPSLPVRYAGPADEVTPQKLLRFLKEHSLARWSLKEALETASDLDPEILGEARAEQREDDLAAAEKQQMIQKMMTTLKKEKGLVDMGEMMGLKQAADALGEKDGKKDPDVKKKDKKKAKLVPPPMVSEEEAAARRAQRKAQLEKEAARDHDLELKDKEKRKQRKAADKARQAKKKQQEADAKAMEAAEREKRRRQLEEERSLRPTTPLFAWGQSKEQLRLSLSIPALRNDSLNVNLTDDRVAVAARDARNRSYTLDFELREFVVASNSSWSLRYSEDDPMNPKPDGLTITMQKVVPHRWDRLAQDHAAIKQFLRKDWVQDDGELEEEKEDADLPSGQNLKKVSAFALGELMATSSMVVAALRFPWCDKCAEKDRYFQKAAAASKGKDHLDSIVWVTVDVREEKYLARKHNISCRDTCDLLMFKQDEPDVPYLVPGRKFMEEIHIDCYKHLLPVVNDISDRSTLERVTSAFDTAIVGFFKAPKVQETQFPQFRDVARRLRGHALFGAVFSGLRPQDLGIDHNSTGPLSDRPLVLLFKPKEARHVEFEGDLTLDRLTRFSKILSMPLISEYGFENRQKYKELAVPLGMLWIDGEKDDGEDNANAIDTLKRLAHRFSGHLVFVKLNHTRDAMLMRPMALDPRRVPAFGIATADDMESPKYGFDLQVSGRTERSAFWANKDYAFAQLEAFCASFLRGDLEPSHESGALDPSYSWPGPGQVHWVVWKSFKESIYRCDHDVLLELYSPFRPQHRTYLSVLDLVAEALKSVPNLKVARMDTENNFVPPEFGKDKEDKGSAYYFIRAAPEEHRRPRRFGGKAGGRADDLPERLLRFVHREAHSADSWELSEKVAWVNTEAHKRIRRLKAIEKDYEKKMQDEWMQKELEEFERYKRLGKFDSLPMNGM